MSTTYASVASVVLPGDEAHKGLGRGWLPWVAAGATVVLTTGAAVGLAMWAWAMLNTPIVDDPAQAAEAVILSGQPPAVAATAGGRIVDLDCVVTRPVAVAADGTGAFTVLGGARRVDCPQAEFRSGMTLRWPLDATPATVPPGNP